MKNKVNLSENQIRNIINKSVKRIIKEGTSDERIYNAWNTIEERLGAENFLSNIFDMLDCDTLEKLVHWIDTDYELGLFDEAESEVDDEEEYVSESTEWPIDAEFDRNLNVFNDPSVAHAYSHGDDVSYIQGPTLNNRIKRNFGHNTKVVNNRLKRIK